MITPEQLKPFCGNDDTREILKEPCNKDGFTWATDGRILIRVPLIPGVPAELPKGKYPDVANAWQQFDPLADFQPLPALPELAPDENVECNLCDGEGSVFCPYCENHGECHACNGTGKVIHREKRWTRVGGAPFRVHLLQKIATLPNPRISVNAASKPSLTEGGERVPGSIASFICDGGGAGLLMSLKDDGLDPDTEWKFQPATA